MLITDLGAVPCRETNAPNGGAPNDRRKSVKLKSLAMGMVVPLAAGIALSAAPAASAAPVASIQKAARQDDGSWRDRGCDWRWDRDRRDWRCDHRDHRDRGDHRGRHR